MDSNITAKTWVNKRKNKLDFIKVKKCCTPKDIIKKVKKTTYRTGENICKSYIW